MAYGLPSIILVRPRNPLNIGAAARAMANFGFDDLRVVAPHPPVWAEALRAAPGAERLLKKAKLFATLRDAVADRTEGLATSCMSRRARALPAQSVKGLRPRAAGAVVFGPEKSGLSAADLAYCGGIVSIPTVADCPSMNLGQSVAVFCWELVRAGPQPFREGAPAAVDDLERIIERCDQALARIGYRGLMDPQVRRNRVRRILLRRGLLKGEAGMLYEILRRILDKPVWGPKP